MLKPLPFTKMAVTYENVTRALSVLKELLVDSEGSSVEPNILRPLEKTVATLGSPLFKSLVHISNTYNVLDNHKSHDPSLKSCNSLTSEKRYREVTFIKRSHNLGLRITGLSRTGLYIGELIKGGVADGCGQIQVGDRILSINDKSCDSMASFEVQYLLQELAVGEKIHMKLRYEPTGLMEYLKEMKR